MMDGHLEDRTLRSHQSHQAVDGGQPLQRGTTLKYPPIKILSRSRSSRSTTSSKSLLLHYLSQ